MDVPGMVSGPLKLKRPEGLQAWEGAEEDMNLTMVAQGVSEGRIVAEGVVLEVRCGLDVQIVAERAWVREARDRGDDRMERDNIGWDVDAYVLIKREKRGKGSGPRKSLNGCI
jgi:hypothetical protein